MTRRVLIMTPTAGGYVHAQHHVSVLHASRIDGVSVASAHLWPGDLDRVRSRMMHHACQRVGFTHLFLWDADVSMTMTMFEALIGSPHAFAAGLYMNARGKYPYHGRAVFDEHGWAPVTRVPLGAVCISIDALREASSHADTFVDVLPDTGGRVTTPDLCRLTLDSDGTKLSEDFSFCDRMVATGHRPHIWGRETATHWKTVPLRGQP